MYRMMRQERIAHGWSCEYVAEQTGLTAEAIRLIETGERNPSYPVLVKLEDLFRLSHRQLFAVADDAPQSQGQNSTQNIQNQQY